MVEHHNIGRRLAVFSIAACLGIAPVGGEAAETGVEWESGSDRSGAADLEPNAVLRSASEILPLALLAGPHHRVEDEVLARGFVHYYVIESPFGDFLAAGDEEVRERIHEINAIAELRQYSKSEVIVDSATEAAKRSYAAAKEVVDKPWQTAKAIPSGLTRLFKRSKRKVEDAYEDVSAWYRDGDGDDGSPSGDVAQSTKPRLSMDKIRKAADFGIDEGQDYLRGALGFNKAYRRIAKQLQVDPYTRNAVLRQEMVSMSWTATAGSFAADLVLPDTPYPIGLLEDTRELVWGTNAIDLRVRNEEVVERMRIDPEKLAAFFDNDRFTLSEQTRLIQAVERLSGTDNAGHLIEEAAQAQSREETRFFVRSAELLALYHERRTPVAALIDDGQTPVAARDRADRLIVVLPLDYVNWSPTAHENAMAMQASLARHNRGTVSEVWIEGSISPRALRELWKLGWTVKPAALDILASGGDRG